MGAVLAAICCLALWGSAYVALTGRPVHRLIGDLIGRHALLPLLFFAIAAWGWKIFIHLTGHDGWH